MKPQQFYYSKKLLVPIVLFSTFFMIMGIYTLTSFSGSYSGNSIETIIPVFMILYSLIMYFIFLPKLLEKKFLLEVTEKYLTYKQGDSYLTIPWNEIQNINHASVPFKNIIVITPYYPQKWRSQSDHSFLYKSMNLTKIFVGSDFYFICLLTGTNEERILNTLQEYHAAALKRDSITA